MRRLGPLIYRPQRDYRERANRISNAEAFLHRLEGWKMNLAIWMPAMFLLGIAGMVLCILFLEAYVKI